MTIKALIASAIVLAIPAAGHAAVTVIGSSNARLCFEAAESEVSFVGREALERCDVALTEEGLSSEDIVATHVNRGILRARRGDVSGAYSDFDQATALDPDEPEAYLNKALVLTLKSNEASKALPLFRIALDKRTKRPELAYFGRGVAHEELGDLKLAYADYNQALAAAPKWDLPRAELARFVVRR